MLLFRLSFFCLPLFLFVGTLSAQSLENKVDYILETDKPTSLLWRISGNGLPHQSYIYGTYHITDEKVFEFGDSVLTAIMKCDAFAVEVRLDTLVNELLSMIYDTTGNFIKLKDVLSQQELDSIATLISDNLNIPLASVHNLRPYGVLNILKSSGYLTTYVKQRAMFLDAYLLGFARTLKKELLGLEHNTEQQISSLDTYAAKELRRYLKKSNNINERLRDGLVMDRILRLYSKGNIDSLYSWSMNLKDSTENAIFNDRNRVMARTIDSVSRNKSLFSAMGAAHLSGKEGVINLLRGMGYTVEPIIASYNRTKEWFDTLDVTISTPWYDYVSSKHGFSVKTPNKLTESPIHNKWYENVELESPTTKDIISGNSFSVLAMRLPGRMNDSLFSQYFKTVLKTVKRSLSTKKDTTMPENIELNGLNGLKYKGYTKTGEYFIMSGFHKNTTVYLLMVEGSRKSTSLAIVDTFLTSLKLTPVKRQEWIPFSDTISSISISFPGKPLSIIDEELNTPLYYMSDTETGAVFNLRSWQLRSSIDEPTLKSYCKNMIVNFMNKYEADSVIKYIIYDTLPDGVFRTRYTSYQKRTSTVFCGSTFVRNKMVHSLTYIYPLGMFNEHDSAKFFGSLQFLPIQREDKWKQYHSANWNLYADFPGEPLIDTVRNDDFTNYEPWQYVWFKYDMRGQRDYSIFINKLAPYYSLNRKNDSAFYGDFLIPQLSDNDTIVQSIKSKQGNTIIHEYVVEMKKAPFARRIRYYMVGDTTYTVLVGTTKSDLQSPDIHRFFNSIRVGDSTTTVFDYKIDRRIQWLEDLCGTDTLRHYNAVNSLKWIVFDSTHTSLLASALRHNKFISDTLNSDQSYRSYPLTLRGQLLNEYLSIIDSTHADTLKELYKVMTGYPLQQLSILTNLARHRTPATTQFVVDILRSAPPTTNDTIPIYTNTLMYELGLDSCKLIAPYILSLSSLINSYHYSAPYYNLLTSALVIGLISKNDYAKINKQSVELLRQKWQLYSASIKKPKKNKYVINLDDDETQEYDVYDTKAGEIVSELCTYFYHVGYDKKTEKILRSILSTLDGKNINLTFQATMALLRWKKPVNDTVVPYIFNTYWQKSAVVNALDSLGLVALIPSEYRSQEASAKSHLKEYFYEYDYEDEIDSMIYLKRVSINNDSLKGYAYLIAYRSLYSDSGKFSVVLVGMFPDTLSLQSPSNSFIRTSWKYLDEISEEQHVSDIIANKERTYELPSDDD